MLIAGDILVNYGVPLSIILVLFLSRVSRSRVSKYVLLVGGLFLLFAYMTVLLFGYSCDGHPFIGYARCGLFSDGLAGLASKFNAFAVVAYLFFAGPIAGLTILAEVIFRYRNRNGRRAT